MDELELLVQAVRKSPKYRDVCPDVVRNVGARELAARRNSRQPRHSAETAERSPAEPCRERRAEYRDAGCSPANYAGWGSDSDSGERGTEYRLRDAVKATKNKLHQVGGAYWDAADYAGWLDQLRSAAKAGSESRHSASPAKNAGRSTGSAERSSGERGTEYRGELRRICWEAMKHHSSTRERLLILDQFYTRTLAGLPPPQVVLDIACGLNPLAISWMPFPPDVEYYAYDMYDDLANFLNAFMGIAGVQGHAEACDVSACPPTRRADLALILKTLPCLEQLDRLAGARLLEAVQAEHLLVSFPVRSLGGRDKRMLQNYEAHFQELLWGKPWAVQRFEFPSELAFLIHK
jgi:16S rRNA (guanine(1405)-N(7))-methyltransferase